MKKIIYLFALVMLVSGCASVGHISKDEDGWSLIGKTYYTKFNIWYDNTGESYLAGVYSGEMLPVGTEIKIDSYSFGNKKLDHRGYIRFKPINTSIKLPSSGVITLEYRIRPHLIGWAELLDRYISKQAITEEFNKFTEIEKENIKNGNIVVGMSKESVLMAWGYPLWIVPGLSANTWEYRVSGSKDSILIYFINNKINSIFMPDTLTLEQVKKAVIREMKGSYENIYAACKTVLVERGYVIKDKDISSGLITAVLDAKTAKRNRLTQRSTAGKLGPVIGTAMLFPFVHGGGSRGFGNVELRCTVNKVSDTVSRVEIWDNGRYPSDSRSNGVLIARIRYYDKVFYEIEKATQENKSQIETLAQKASNADEILKYKQLLDSGAITKEEYEQQKKQLLGGSVVEYEQKKEQLSDDLVLSRQTKETVIEVAGKPKEEIAGTNLLAVQKQLERLRGKDVNQVEEVLGKSVSETTLGDLIGRGYIVNGVSVVVYFDKEDVVSGWYI